MRTWLLFTTGLVTFLLDRVSKLWAYHTLSNDSYSITSWLNVELSWNRGVSWSLFSSDNAIVFWILTLCIAGLITALAVFIGQHIAHRTAHVYEMLILAGAVSNLYDRFYYGAVLDFIQLHWYNWYWPTFNVADAAIVCGVAGTLVLHWWKNRL